MTNRHTTILCSGFGLGFYIPGILVARGLEKRGVSSDIFVFESVLDPEKQRRIDDSKAAYHIHFAAAQLATKLPKDIRDSIDVGAAQRLIEQWDLEEREHFIALSGNWVYILDLYREHRISNRHKAPQVDLLYVDSDYSPSWKSMKKFVPDFKSRYQEIWLYRAEIGDIERCIPVGEEDPISYDTRRPSYVVHGGGWGIGTYRNEAEELERLGISLDIVAYLEEEAGQELNGNRCFMNDPKWRAWEISPGRTPGFPPFAQIVPGETPVYKAPLEHHGLYGVIRHASGIISKPGAGTLMDSLASATPLIMLDPFGKHEAHNAALWQKLGFGIPMADWKAAGYSREALLPLHERLLAARANAKDYIEEYANALCGA
ncbi:UDP-glucuronosyltransferase [Paenibacillus sp. LMG 31461]|uniref:UDP-glucuronosyltransferase n=1 Tax=Paenibacillus plantarum TaxID=2654975 RepID=A0ABX1X6R3_9BACL|nr:UDP-glucuronosyltransferase [Paenibacillus plantarum]NOU64061.1 UDP-glucuronosyltransferase [Paenibacillus plantarum]